MGRPYNQQWIPPNLKMLIAEEHLTGDDVRSLLEVAGTVRGRYPAAVDEWRELWELMQRYAVDSAPPAVASIGDDDGSP